MILEFNTNLDDCPFNEHVYFLFSDKTIHSGQKEKHMAYRYLGTPNQEEIECKSFEPLGINTTYSADPYFDTDPIAWCSQKTICDKITDPQN